jgi:hypothetical protein
LASLRDPGVVAVKAFNRKERKVSANSQRKERRKESRQRELTADS